LRLSTLIEDIDTVAAGLKIIGMEGDVEVSSISLDSRELGGPGALFAALPGELSDGYDYIEDALSAGAVCVLAEKVKEDANVPQIIVSDARAALASISETFYGSPASKMRLVGITGTNGKTTTSYIIESIFLAAGLKCGVIGTVNCRYDDLVLESAHTTPESLDLSSLMADMFASNVSHVVIEVSSHALTQKRADGCRFSSAVFTNLTHEHLDYHHSMENYFESKARLFKELMKENGTPVVNIDDKWGCALAGKISDVITYSITQRADIYPKEYAVAKDGITAILNTPSGELKIESALVGEYNLSNIMAAIGAALSLGIDVKAISAGISALERVPGRLEVVGESEEIEAPRFIVDYAHTADALKTVLSALRKITKGRIITVFGCGGDRDAAKRPLMGEAATSLSDISIITTDNPRSEEPAKIIEDIEAGIKGVRRFNTGEQTPEKGYMVLAERRDAIRRAVALASANDTVLVAGKGHEDYQLVGDKSFSFDDREELKLALKEHSASSGVHH
jgi:UDP-N-acetylmuramoyl-L-alanyl-D-glutamate--2,6-diaminopimelate ligase